MTGWVIIPVKSLVDGKSRLAEVLSPARRRRFNENALSHVIATVRDGFDAEHLLVVSGCAEPAASRRPSVRRRSTSRVVVASIERSNLPATMG